MDKYSAFCSYLKEYGIDDIIQLFEEAERKITSSEVYAEELSISSINEQRYSLYHLLRAIGNRETVGEIKKEIRNVKKHLIRSIYDSNELTALFFLKKIDEFSSDYRLVNVTKIIPEYGDFMIEVQEIKKRITDTKKSGEDEFLSHKSSMVNRLAEINEVIQQARKYLNEMSENQKSRSYRIVINALIATLVGLATSVLFFIKM